MFARIVLAAVLAVASGFRRSSQNNSQAGATAVQAANKYSPASVQEAWQNHLDAFVAQDVDKIALDYDEDSVLQIFYDNDWTRDGGRGTLEEFVGVDAIKGFFTALFSGLETADINVPAFKEGGGNPVVEGGDVNSAHVFLVWQAVNSGILKATDTFFWTKTFKVRKQNIVATVAGPAPGNPRRNPPKPTPTTGPIASGWQNHFKAFGAQDTPKILADYTEQSVIRVWDWTTATYSESKGLAAIEALFNGLWVAITAAEVGGDPGIGLPDEFPRVEVGKKSVFLVWRSYSHVQATDSFLFDDKGKITVQTIVVSTKVEEATKVFPGGCPPGQQLSRRECIDIASALGLKWKGTKKWGSKPAGCLQLGKNKHSVYFNKHKTGTAGTSVSSICLSKAKLTPGPTPGPTPLP